MDSERLLGTRFLTLNQAIEEIKKVFQTCNKLNLAELVDKKVLKTCFVCPMHIGLMEGEKLRELLHTIECEPIHSEIGSLISGEIRELTISQVKYKNQNCRVLIKNKFSDWSLEEIQEQLKCKPLSLNHLGFELSHTPLNTDNLFIDSQSLYEYLDFKPEKLLIAIEDLTTKLALQDKEIWHLRSRGASTYSTPALEVVKAVIQEFWEDWTPESNKTLNKSQLRIG